MTLSKHVCTFTALALGLANASAQPPVPKHSPEEVMKKARDLGTLEILLGPTRNTGGSTQPVAAPPPLPNFAGFNNRR